MKQEWKDKIKEFPFLYEALRKIYKVLFPSVPVTNIIEAALAGKSSVFFVQVGSNDGKQGDPIHPLIMKNQGWSGIFIEPVSYLFRRLQDNYQHAPRFIFENVAIGAEKGTATFYYVSEKAKAELGEEIPEWYDQLGSFDRDHIVKQLKGKLIPYIIEEKIECLPLQELLDRNNVKDLDLLHIDTEGFDYQVLSQVDFKKYHPAVVLYEHKHLSIDEKEKARMLLKESGYELAEYGGDTLARRVS